MALTATGRRNDGRDAAPDVMLPPTLPL